MQLPYSRGNSGLPKDLCSVCLYTKDRNAVQNVWQGHGLRQTVIFSFHCSALVCGMETKANTFRLADEANILGLADKTNILGLADLNPTLSALKDCALCVRI